MPRADEKLESNQRWLKRLARRMARSPASAEDLVQDTYLTALSKPPPDGPMRPWLLGVMRKLAWGEVRSGRRRAHREECFQLTGSSVVEPDPLLAYGIDRARLRSLVEGLPEPFRSTVEQRFLEGLSCVEIADVAGVPAGTVRWRQSRALELLRAELERPRRRTRRGLFWLPLVGLERAMAAGPRALGVSGRARTGLALAGIALVVALASLAGGDRPAGRVTVAEARSHSSSRPGSAAAAAPEAVASEAGDDAIPASTSSRRAGGELIAGARRARREHASRSRPPRAGLDAAPARVARELYDCTEADGDVRCAREPVADHPQPGPVCLILDRSLSALARARAHAPGRSIDEAAFLRAARLANMVLASELGCSLSPEPEREERRGGGGGRTPEAAPPEREPSCQTEEDDTGRSCTTCTDALGVPTTVCAPVDCEPSTRTDGSPCTVCTDADGETESDCELEPEPEPESESGGCASVLGDVDVFASEVLPILTGDIDLNNPEGGSPIAGCTRGPCHASPGSSALYLDPADTPENNLERFACFVDRARPEESQVLLCPVNDERCATSPHPGGEQLTGADDLNYQRILAFIQAAAL